MDSGGDGAMEWFVFCRLENGWEWMEGGVLGLGVVRGERGRRLVEVLSILLRLVIREVQFLKV